jgi:hypothetical protein
VTTSAFLDTYLVRLPTSGLLDSQRDYGTSVATPRESGLASDGETLLKSSRLLGQPHGIKDALAKRRA